MYPHNSFVARHPPSTIWKQENWVELLLNGELDDEKLENLRSISESVDLSTEGDEADILDRLNKYVDATGGGKKGGADNGSKPPTPTKKKSIKKKRRGRGSPKKAATAPKKTVTPSAGDANHGHSNSTVTTESESSSDEEVATQHPPKKRRRSMSTKDTSDALELYGNDYDELKDYYEKAFGETTEGKGLTSGDIRKELWHVRYMRKPSN